MSDTNEYCEYTKIEKHMEISKSLYILDQHGKYIIDKIIHKKCQGTRKRTGTYIFSDDFTIIYNNIINCLSIKRLNNNHANGAIV